MKRWLLLPSIALALLVTLIFAAAREGSPDRPDNRRARAQDDGDAMKVSVIPWGPTQEMIDAASSRLSRNPLVLRRMKGARTRLVSFELVAEDEKGDAEPSPPTRYRGTFYDYTNDQTYVAEGSFAKSDDVVLSPSASQPLPSAEEIDEALSVLKSDPKLGPAVEDGRLQFYPPMPPLYTPARTRGRAERWLNVGLRARDPGDDTVPANEIVSVNLSRGAVLRFPAGAPPASKAGPDATCGPASGGSSTGRGVAGQYQFTLTAQDGTELWSFLAVRPSASSGSDASGIELLQVKYKGKLLLKRAHVPVLNVNYDGNTCGPFRDWQYSESQFNADPTNGTNVAPGVRSCTVPATTQLDSGVDTGNHQGIAFYTVGNETVLVSELSAGWYRYISEWRFDVDGTLRPRYGMGATSNSCTCNGHIHHAYWRLDFDIDGSSPNRAVQTGGSAPIPARESVTGVRRPAPINPPIINEVKLYRSKGVYYMVRNPSTNRAYLIVPNDNDGTAIDESYGKGDVWFLRYSKSEIDDSTVRTNTSANIDAFVNGQLVEDNDLVVWYGVHINHNRPGGHPMGHPFINGQFVAGPDIIPYRW